MKNTKTSEMPTNIDSNEKNSPVSEEYSVALTTALQSISKLIVASTEKTISEMNEKNKDARDGASIAYNTASEIEKMITLASLIEHKDR